MPRADAGSAECFVYTFKEGLLSAVAHDLKLRVTRFSVDLADGAVTAEFAADSLRVLHALREGREDPAALSEADRRKIERNIVEEVLLAGRYPTVRYVSTSVVASAEGFDISGELTLHGTRRPLRVQAKKVGSHFVAQVVLHQPDFGIKPYSAMLGALRIRPDVRIELSVPTSAYGKTE
jgi:hypothetical protein